jgi:hypothetical protein
VHLDPTSPVLPTGRAAGDRRPALPSGSFRLALSCVMLSPMGSKDKGKKEVKKPPKPKPKPEPGRRRETLTPAPPK